MLLRVENIVRRLAPQLLPNERISAILVHTTRPKYLLFGSSSVAPICVVSFGSLEELKETHEILQRLYQQVPDLVARSHLLEPFDQGHVHVQAGLPGVPWFQLSLEIETNSAWSILVERVLDALDRLHAAVRRFPDWVHVVTPGREIRTQLGILGGRETLSCHLVDGLMAHAEVLDPIGSIPCISQHGDFCFNNLMVSESRIGIIDFDEFGRTAMPMHDAIGLKESLHEISPSASLALSDYIIFRELERYDGHINMAHVPALRVHYLLWRINRCHGLTSRSRAKAGLMCELEASAK